MFGEVQCLLVLEFQLLKFFVYLSDRLSEKLAADMEVAFSGLGEF